MVKHPHVLISSVSRKVPLIKAVRLAAAKAKIPARIFGGDRDPLCIGRHFVDHFWQMPSIDDLSIDDLVAYCHSQKIGFLIPTRDGELPFYAQHWERLSKEGIHVMISSLEAIACCLDKLFFYQTIRRIGVKVIPTALYLEGLSSKPVTSFVVKERFGAGSQNIGLNLTPTQALQQAKRLKDPIFQPFIEGKEVSIDLYMTQEGVAKGVILRERERVVGGESQVTSTFQDTVLEKSFAELAETLRLRGHVMFQALFSSVDRQYHLLECNPRFGGASTLSLAMGLDSFYWFFLEELGENLSKCAYQRSQGEKRLIRHPEDLIVPCLIDV